MTIGTRTLNADSITCSKWLIKKEVGLIKGKTSWSTIIYISWITTRKVLIHIIRCQINCLHLLIIYIDIQRTIQTHSVTRIRHCKAHCHTISISLHGPFGVGAIRRKLNIRLTRSLWSYILTVPSRRGLQGGTSSKTCCFRVITCVRHQSTHSSLGISWRDIPVISVRCLWHHRTRQ